MYGRGMFTYICFWLTLLSSWQVGQRKSISNKDLTNIGLLCFFAL